VKNSKSIIVGIIVISAMIIFIVSSSFIKERDSNKIATQTLVNSLMIEIERFKSSCGHFPKDLKDIEVASSPKCYKATIEIIPYDFWDRELIYQVNNEQAYLYSLGKDNIKASSKEH